MVTLWFVMSLTLVKHQNNNMDITEGFVEEPCTFCFGFYRRATLFPTEALFSSSPGVREGVGSGETLETSVMLETIRNTGIT